MALSHEEREKTASSTEKRILEGLNPVQREAVTFGEGPLLIIAGAGTGKTTVITQRIAYLIATKKVKPEEILALTFTDKAAAEMEERVDLLIPYGYTNVWISTFHAFGDRVLREHALDIGLSTDFRLLRRPEQIIFFKEHLFDFPLKHYRPLGNPARHIEALITLISRAKDEDVSSEEYLSYAERLKRESENHPDDKELAEEAAKQMEIARTYEKYQELKARYGFIDFGDQVNLTLKLLREHPTVLRQYHERFRYILVDEFQDTNYAQFQMVRLLASFQNNITVVGDDDQSIYKFRGAAISNILGFKDEYPEAKELVLSNNYRSHQKILDAAYALINHNNPERLEIKSRINKRLIAEKKEGLPIQHLSFDALASEADGIAGHIRDEVEKGTYRYRDFAVLVRSNNDADPYLRALNMLGIPHRFSGNQGLYNRPEIRLLLSFFRIMTNLNDSLSLYYLVSSEIYQMDLTDLAKCMSYADMKHFSLYKIFSGLEKLDMSGDISEEGKGVIARVLEDIGRYIDMSGTLSAGQLLYRFCFDSGYIKRLTKEETVENKEKIQNIAKFFDIVMRIEGILSDKSAREFTQYLNMLITAGDDPAVAETDFEMDAVNVLTVHKAKGLEFPVVFLVSLVANKFPWPHRHEPIPLPVELIKEIIPSGDFHIQEERRLFYVGMTRAVKELYLTSARDYGGSRPRKISQFVTETLDLPKASPPVTKTSPLQKIQRHAPLGKKSADEEAEIPGDKVLTLSYYQMDDYLTCPLKYKYIHILRVPILRHHTIIFGKALHEAITGYYRRKMTGKVMSLDELFFLFEAAWVNEGFITPEHEKQCLEAGKKALQSFFEKEEGSKEVPKFIEKDFSFMIDRDRIVGRWDKIEEKNGKAVVVDFKSSDVRSPDEADKKTKESLQLTLYALAFREVFGKIPEVELYFIQSGLVGTAKKEEKDFTKILSLIKEASQGIRKRDFRAKPGYMACLYCAYRDICPYTERRTKG